MSAGRVGRIVPILSWLPHYHRSWLAVDAAAGVAVAAVAIPTAMGYSAVAVVPVQVGLYALPAALLLYALFGSSRQLAIGPTSTVALMSGAVIAGIGGTTDIKRAIALTAGVAVAAGLWLALFGVLRLGWVTDFISRPVIVGFSFGLGLTVLAGELPHILGLPPGQPHFVQRVVSTLGQVGETNPETLAIGVVGLTILFVGSARWPRIPWALILMAAGVVMARVWDPRQHGVEVLGSVPRGLPTITVPTLAGADLAPVVLGGLAVAVAGVGEGLSAARIFASQGGYRINADSEFLGTGLANVGAGLSGGMSVCGSLSRTSTAVKSGARTQVSGLVAAMVTLVFLMTLTGLLEGVPRVILSCIVVISVWFLLDVSDLRRYRRVRRNDFVSSLAGLGGVLLFGPLYGLLAAVALSLLGLVYRSSRVHVDALGRIPGEKAGWGAVKKHPERTPVDAVLILRLDAPLFWANCATTHARILEQLDDAVDVKALVLDLEATGQMDTTTVEMLTALLNELRREGVELFIARLHYPARVVLARAGFADELGPGHVWHSISQTVAAASQFARGEPLPDIGDALAGDREN
ncbi:MAG: SulP family inorganic anion transporter [Candidatus Nanopelagicales bacterium]